MKGSAQAGQQMEQNGESARRSARRRPPGWPGSCGQLPDLRRRGQIDGNFLELAVAHQALEAPLEQPEATGRTPGAGHPAARLRLWAIASVVAVGAADRLVDHLVDEAQRLEAQAVMPIVSGHVGARSALFQRMEAQPSGEITE